MLLIRIVEYECSSPLQTAFLKGKLILDSFVTASEIINWGSKVRTEFVGIKADFENTFDKVNWGFLSRILFWLGANLKWCDWIDQCISNAKVAVLVNGAPTKWFKLKRGLRQGDPLAPFLFLLVAEAMARMTERAIGNNLIRRVGPTDRTEIALIQYADDTIFFCEAKKKQVCNLTFIWRIFEWASGLKINRSKSELFYLGNRPSKGERLAGILECTLGSLPIRYLGLPLTPHNIQKEDWRIIINKIKKRIDGWQAKLLSQGGRLILVNSVLSSLPLYFFSVFRALKWVIRRIDSLRRSFFWKGRSTIFGKQCLVSWGVVCRARKEGGLGILNLETQNFALLAK